MSLSTEAIFFAGETADWLQPTRVRIASARACALEAIVEDLIRGEQYASALSYGLELTEADRGHENATRLVMRCYATLGQRTRALETYQHLRAYLAEQIGVEPTSETRELCTPNSSAGSSPKDCAPSILVL